jgi:hypothetical protein
MSLPVVLRDAEGSTVAELTIHLRRDAETGLPVIRVSLQSDEDALPHEHERQHQQLVSRLLPAVDAGCGADGWLVVERERPAREPVLG